MSRGGHKLRAALDALRDRPHRTARARRGRVDGRASPTACCKRARPRSSRSTSGGASSRGRCAPTSGSPWSSAPTSASCTPARSARRSISWSSICRSSRCDSSPRTCSSSRLSVADFVLLIKPQFEAGRERVGKGGVIRDPAVHRVGARRGRRRARRGGSRDRRGDPQPDAGRRRQRRVPRVRRAGRRRRSPPKTSITPSRRHRRAPGQNEAVEAVGLVAHHERAVAHELAAWAHAWLVERGVEVRVPETDAACGRARGLRGAGRRTSRRASTSSSCSAATAPCSARCGLVYPEPVPILGVNAGSSAISSAIEPTELEATLPRLLRGDFEVSERMMLEVVVKPSRATTAWSSGPSSR